MVRLLSISGLARRRILACAAALAALGAAGAVAQEGAAYLAQRGLVQQQDRWLLPLDVTMRQQVRRLPELDRRLMESRNNARQLAKTLFAANAQARLQMVEAETNIKALQAGREKIRSEGGRKRVDAVIASEQERLAALRKAWVEPAMIAGIPAVQQAMIDLTNRRNDLSVAILSIHDARPQLRSAYEKLAGDQQIVAALKQAGSAQRLGASEEFDSKRFLKRLAHYEQQVFTDDLPLYRVGDEMRVSALIGRTPVTFTWQSSSEPTMLTASVIEAAGLTVPDDAPQMQRRFPDDRKLTVRRFKIPYLRFGRHVFKDVPAFALPPEGERYGAQIGPIALEGQSPRAEPERMRLVLRAD